MLEMGQKQTFADKCYKDKTDRIVLWQAPNLPIIIWAVAALLSRLVEQGAAHKVFILAAFLAIVIWALMEIFQGVNYFRRTLGLVVLAFTIYGHFFR